MSENSLSSQVVPLLSKLKYFKNEKYSCPEQNVQKTFIQVEIPHSI